MTSVNWCRLISSLLLKHFWCIFELSWVVKQKVYFCATFQEVRFYVPLHQEVCVISIGRFTSYWRCVDHEHPLHQAALWLPLLWVGIKDDWFGTFLYLLAKALVM